MKRKIAISILSAGMMFLAFQPVRIYAQQNQFSAILHIYVPEKWSRDINILFNDKSICMLKGKMMLTYELFSVGYLRITIKTQEPFGQKWVNNINVNINAGETYYFSINPPTWRWSKFEITEKEKGMGEREVAKEKFKDKKVIDMKEDTSSPITEPPLK